MTAPHLHLLLNEIPIIAGVIALLYLLYGVWKNRTDLIKLSIGVFLALSVLTYPIYYSGELAHETVKEIDSVQPRHELLHEHEEAGELAMYASLAFGLVCLIALLYYQKKSEINRPFLAVLVLLAGLTAGLLIRAANIGGHIRHPEIAPNFQIPETESPEEQNQTEIGPASDTKTQPADQHEHNNHTH